jgi:hypothetical protein
LIKKLKRLNERPPTPFIREDIPLKGEKEILRKL